MKKLTLQNKSVLNTISGLTYQVINTVLGLVLPYLFITQFGSETNGVLNSIAQLFVYINLLEAGVGAATVQALYKPLSSNDRSTANEIMSATHRYYLRTGFIYAGVVTGLSLLYPALIKVELSFWTVFGIIAIEGVSSVIRFLFHAKYTLLLKAVGKSYIINNVALIATIIRNAGKIVAISFGADVLFVQGITFVVTILQSILTVAYVKHNYPWLSFHEKPRFEAISQKNAALLQEITWLVFNHTDVILLTIVLQDFKLISVYSIYLLVFEAIQNAIDTVQKSLQYRMGFAWGKSVQALNNYFVRYEKFYYVLSFSLLNVTYILISAFMKLYIGDVSDANYSIPLLPELFLIMKLLYVVRLLFTQMVAAVGHFKQIRSIAVGEMVINITVSVMLVFVWGIHGVLVGTIVALLYSSLAYMRYAGKNILSKKLTYTMKCLVINGVTTVCCCQLGRILLPDIKTIMHLIFSAVPVTIIVIAVFALVNVAVYLFDKRHICHE